jgi:hypothetical protein
MSDHASAHVFTKVVDINVAVSDATLHRFVPVVIVESAIFGAVHRSL